MRLSSPGCSFQLPTLVIAAALVASLAGCHRKDGSAKQPRELGPVAAHNPMVPKAAPGQLAPTQPAAPTKPATSHPAAPTDAAPGQPSTGKAAPGQPSAPGQPDTGQPKPGQPDTGKPTPGQPDTGKPKPGQPDTGKPAPGSTPKPDPTPKPGTTGRIVAIGDLHGDLNATRKVLRLAKIIDKQDRWIGKDTILVQTGDVLDRGDDEPQIFELLWSLQDQAPKSGGRVELLLGNHEIMNANGDLRYVTPGGFADYANTPLPPEWKLSPEEKAKLPAGFLGRKAAFLPGSKLARRLATQNIAAKVGDTVFVHGGIAPAFATMGIERINAQTKAWLSGQGELPVALQDPTGPIWHRDFGAFPDPQDCENLARSLAALGAKRMVVGHTVHKEGIGSACNDQIWRIDVGMSAHYGGPPQALEILGDKIRVLK